MTFRTLTNTTLGNAIAAVHDGMVSAQTQCKEHEIGSPEWTKAARVALAAQAAGAALCELAKAHDAAQD